MDPSTQLFNEKGQPIRLGRELGRGGEGAVYDLPALGNFVAKLYHSPITSAKAEKLNAIVRESSPELLKFAAWPTGTLHDGGRNTVGFIMPKIVGYRDIHRLYGPSVRETEFPKATWAFLIRAASNCATAFEVVHARQQVIGDVNERNVAVSLQALACLIDCDSFQITSGDRVYRCEVGVPTYTPPELQNQDFTLVTRTPNHDAFGLAILIFHLLFMGRHPFAGRYLGPGDMPIEKAISESRFAYAPWAAKHQMTPPPFTLRLGHLPDLISSMFEQAFDRKSIAPGSRPTAAQWRLALTDLESHLKTCTADKSHEYFGRLTRCPWCEIMHDGGPNFFASVFVVNFAVAFADGQRAAEELWKELEGLRPLENKSPPIPSRSSFQPRPAPLPNYLREKLSSIKVMRMFALSSLVGCVLFHWQFTLGCVAAGMAIFFGIIWGILRADDGLVCEKRERKRIRGQCRNILNYWKRRWDHDVAGAALNYVELRQKASTQCQSLRKIGAEYQAQLSRLEANVRETQLRQWLRTHIIADARISPIGAAVSSQLAAYGIETACDLDERRLQEIPGVGFQVVDLLMKWKRGLEANFRHVPHNDVSPQETKMLQSRFLQHQQSSLLQVRRLLAQLREIEQKSAVDAAELRQRLSVAASEYWQSQADLDECR